MTINAVKILLAAISTFSVGMLLAPYWLTFLKRHELWKKKSVEKALSGEAATITQSIHKDEEKKIPRLGGAIIWLSVLIVASLFWLLSEYIPLINKIDFVSRNQTWIIIATMVITGIIGAIDDLSSCGKKIWLIGDKGLSFVWRNFVLVAIMAGSIAYWFIFKLEMLELFVPFLGFVYFGYLIIVIIILAVIIMSCVSVIDGIDGLSGGLFAVAFASYGIIAIAQDQINIAAFCFAVVGACTAFLWYNIMPAKFYNSETGMLSLSVSLTIIALLTNQLFVLPIIAAPLLSGPISSFLQIFSKKFFGRKIFVVAPMHHHFQAIGFASHTVVMRYWIVSIMCAFVGIILALAGSL